MEFNNWLSSVYLQVTEGDSVGFPNTPEVSLSYLRPAPSSRRTGTLLLICHPFYPFPQKLYTIYVCVCVCVYIYIYIKCYVLVLTATYSYMNGIVKYICVASWFLINVKFVRFMPLLCSGSLYIFADEIVFIHMKRISQNFWIWSQQGLIWGEPEGRGKQTPLLKGAYKISHAPGPWAEAIIWKQPGSEAAADLESLPERQEAAGLTLGTQPLCGAPSTTWTPVLASAILESSLQLTSTSAQTCPSACRQ